MCILVKIRSKVTFFLVGTLTICLSLKWFANPFMSKRLKSPDTSTLQFGYLDSASVNDWYKWSRIVPSSAPGGWYTTAAIIHQKPCGSLLGLRWRHKISWSSQQYNSSKTLYLHCSSFMYAHTPPWLSVFLSLRTRAKFGRKTVWRWLHQR